MRTKYPFLAGVAVAIFCLTIASVASAETDFVFSQASVQEVVYTFNSVPVSCFDYPAASDTYAWNVTVTNIDDDFITDLGNNIYAVAFISGSCSSFTSITNTLFITWGVTSVHPVPVGPIFYADFVGAVPDFDTVNNSNHVNLPFFDDLAFHLVFNENVGTEKVQGLAGRTGQLQVSGNANLCDALTSGPPECFLLDLNFHDYMGNKQDYSCICETPSVTEIDITSVIQP